MADRNSTGSGIDRAPTQRRYPPELRERAVRMVQESYDRGEHRSGVVARIAGQPGIGPRSLRTWVHHAEGGLQSTSQHGR